MCTKTAVRTYSDPTLRMFTNTLDKYLRFFLLFIRDGLDFLFYWFLFYLINNFVSIFVANYIRAKTNYFQRQEKKHRRHYKEHTEKRLGSMQLQ